jgi:hypothetical protein
LDELRAIPSGTARQRAFPKRVDKLGYMHIKASIMAAWSRVFSQGGPNSYSLRPFD